MRTPRWIGLTGPLLLMLLLAGGAAAKRTAPPVRGAELLATIDPDQGFVDQALSLAPDGRLLYVNADAAGLAELVVYDLGARAAAATVDLSGFTSEPVEVRALPGGDYLVVGRGEGGALAAARLDAAGAVRRRYGSAQDIALAEHDGRPVVVLRDVAARRGGGSRYTVTVRDLASGRRVGATTTLEVDESGHSDALDFDLRYWADGYTRAVGIVGGAWNRRDDQRSPDAEGWYDLAHRRFVEKKPIGDVVRHTRMLEIRRRHDNEPRFLEVARDRSALHLHDGATVASLRLAEPFRHYDPATLRTQRAADGTLYFTLAIDPVHPDAAAKRRAVRPWLDLYRVRPGSSRAERRARLLPPRGRALSWWASDDHWAVLPRHVGFDRGGEALLVYRLE